MRMGALWCDTIGWWTKGVVEECTMLKRVDQYEVEWGVPRILSVGATSSSSAAAASGSAGGTGGPPSSSTLIVRVRTCTGRGRHGIRRVRWLV